MLNGLRTVRSFTRQNEVLTRSLRHVQTLYNEEVVQPLNFASCLSIKPRKFASKSFQDLGINESLCNGLKEMNITKPTHIQQRSIEAILAKKGLWIALI
jgi:superfamily II DNA/RNA helicase